MTIRRERTGGCRSCISRAVWLRASIAAITLWVPLSAGTVDDPLEDRDTFLAGMRTRLRADASILGEYAYTRSVVERTLGGDGRVKETHTRVFEVRPFPDDPEGHRWMTMKDGVPTPPVEQQRLEAEYQSRLARARRRLATESAGDRQRRLARVAERDRESRETIEDVLSIYALDVQGREVISGVRTRLVTFEGRPDARPRTRAGGLLKNVTGRAWFSEAEYELVRLEARATRPIRYGWGILARIDEGSSAVIDRRPVQDGTWLPEQYAFTATGRLLLVRGLARQATVTFSNYRRMPAVGSVE